MKASYVNKDYGYFKVVGGPIFKNKEKLWICECECGNTFYRASRFFLKKKRCIDCKGKTLIENPPNKTHGLSHIPEYRIWVEAKYRCSKRSNKAYKRYGGRGIRMSQEWSKSFETFIKDMGYKPSNKHSIERIDVNGDYCKENCKRGTDEDQANNKRNTRYYNGKTLRQISNETGINYKTLRYRTEVMGLNIDDAVSKENRYFKKFDGKTIKEWCLLFGIRYTSFYCMSKKKGGYDNTIAYYREQKGV